MFTVFYNSSIKYAGGASEGWGGVGWEAYEGCLFIMFFFKHVPRDKRGTLRLCYDVPTRLSLSTAEAQLQPLLSMCCFMCFSYVENQQRPAAAKAMHGGNV